jgi:hypothetical protein
VSLATYLLIQFPARHGEITPITQAYFNLDSLWDPEDLPQPDEVLESKLQLVSKAQATRKLNTTEVVIGPCSATLFKYQNKLLWLFGDVHEPESITTKPFIPFAEWIALQSCKGRKVDLFLETGFPADGKANDTYNIRGQITQTQLMFNDCLKTDKKLCPFPNLRIHYWDLRQRFSGSKTILNEENEYTNWLDIDTPEKLLKMCQKLLHHGRTSLYLRHDRHLHRHLPLRRHYHHL